MTPIERQAERAMHRLNEATNRSAGQHMRAIRKAHAPAIPVATPVIDRAQCDPSVDFWCTRQTADDEQEAAEAMGAMTMLVYALASLALTGVTVTVAIAIVIFWKAP